MRVASRNAQVFLLVIAPSSEARPAAYVELEPFRAVGEIEPQCHVPRSVAADAEAVTGVHVLEVEVLFVREHFPSVEEESEIGKSPNLPTILHVLEGFAYLGTGTH